MSIRCPRCLTVVGFEQQVGDVAQCPQCEHLFDVSDGVPVSSPRQGAVSELLDGDASAGASPDVELRARLLPAPPVAVRVEQHDDGLEVRLRWWDDLQIISVAVHAFVTLAMGMSAVGASSSMAAVVPGAIALFLAYNLVTYTVNTTTVWVGRDGIEVVHGPLPSLHANQVVPRLHLRTMTVREVRRRSRGGNEWITYNLESMGAKKPLLKTWNRGESVNYVRDLVQQVFGYGPNA